MTTIGACGKLPKLEDARNLQLKNYIPAKQRPVGMTKSWAEPVDVWPTLGNLEVGCCTCTGIGHGIVCWSANDGHPSMPTTQQIIDAYKKISGYDPTRPETDRGAYMLDAAKLYCGEGIGGHVGEAFAEIERDDVTTMMRALDIFGVLYCGFGLPTTIRNESIWSDTSAPKYSLGGHAMVLVRRSPYVWEGITWGHRQQMTHNFLSRYLDEAYVLVPRYDWTGPDNLSPSHCDTAQLIADAQALRKR